MNDKIKIAWICPLDFSPYLDRLTFHSRPNDVIAPWITLLTEIFEKYTEEAELHVISAPPRLAEDTSLSEKGIHYHFLSNRLPLGGGKMPFLVKKLTRYITLRRKVYKLIKNLNPDIIEFHGAEHDLSWAFFDLDYPKILTPQFFVNNYFRFRPTKYLRYWMKVEKKIYRAGRHFGYRNEHMKKEILMLNPEAVLHLYQYPICRPQAHAADFPQKDADIIFTARLIKSKGIEDLFQAIAEIKKEMPSISAKIIGQCSPDYMDILTKLTQKLKIENNVRFLGFLPTQEEMFSEVARSKLSVLPTHFDLIPGTVLEAMFIGTPVIAYASGGLPELNHETETIRLVETGNIQFLTKEILALLNDDKERELLAAKAREIVCRKFDNELIFQSMMNAYHSIIGRSYNYKIDEC